MANLKILKILFCFCVLLNCALASFENLEKTLDDILEDNINTYGVQNRVKRSEKSKIVMKKQKAELPICQNMKGILGRKLIESFNFKRTKNVKNGVTPTSFSKCSYQNRDNELEIGCNVHAIWQF